MARDGSMNSPRTFAVGITGASGAALAERLVRFLLEAGHHVHLTASRTGKQVVQEELGHPPGSHGILPALAHERLVEWAERDYRAPFASGSAPIDGMAVIPCSLATVAAIAAGTSDNLLRRGADVMLKERRPLVLVPREAPLSVIHLGNLLAVARAGATVIPPVLTFYQRPGKGVEHQIDFVVSRVLDHLGVENELFPRWGTMS
jgi:4-hydroxy-3-polyprenylbenzoate decarboxylase